MFEKGILNLNTGINESGDQTIPVPGGLSEKPSGAPKDTGPSIPQKTDITNAEVVQAINAFQKSFKEGAEVINNLIKSSGITAKNINENGGRDMDNQIYKDYLISFAESGVEGRPLSMEEFNECVDSYIKNDGSIDEFVEGKYHNYKKMIDSKNEDRDENNKLERKKYKDFKADYKKSEEIISGLYKSYKANCKAAGKGKTLSREKFRGYMIAEFQDYLNTAGSNTTTSVATAKSDAKETGFELIPSKRRTATKLISQVANNEIVPTTTTYEKIMDCFSIPGPVAESADLDDTIDHLSAFLSESLPIDV